MNIAMVATTGENIESRIARDIHSMTEKGDLIISGDPIIPLYADRDQPAEAINLAQLRFPRIDNGYLINITADHDVKVIVITYNIVNFKSYVDFIMEHFDFFMGYERPDVYSDVEGEVEVHLNTFNVYVRPDGIEGGTLKDLYFNGQS